ncbi:integral membrane protein [Streptomyces viridochromogenes DSM 40736]|uniref:Integral membrane protein n=2 Tax=Streptomyces viridochromogenes TaxID=1938 RepID=D9XEN8_STRVT|nr:integral membrane protein [Streptomyces viridochromogenes DSM 40736]
MAWMRPTDAVYVAAPLLVLALIRRHGRLLLALTAGLAAGAVDWVIEAYTDHGGLGQRLAEASRIQGGLGWQIAVDDQLRSLGGRALCRPCTGSMPHPLVTAWWFVLPVLAGLALVVAFRARRPSRTVVPLACATTAALPYLFMIGYAAPRFLQPAYALLAIPVADALWHLVRTPRGTWRPVAAALVALGLAGHLAVQLAVLQGAVARNTESRRDWDRTAGALHRLGVRPPCLLTGHEAIPIGYYTGCSSGATSGHNENTTVADVLRTADRLPVAHISPAGGTAPRYARTWPVHRISDLDVRVAPAP